MNITQEQVDALLLWIEDRKSAYLAKGFSLAAEAGIEKLGGMDAAAHLSDADREKSLSDLRSEMLLAEEFYKDARQILFAGRQGG
ncbi:hypothetical protein [Sneathiella glossodoripedis]|uniref:hypothetical protein n=1 Tax=Sneathiella glossodoripedis TaxID=418853 RepID=UPI00046EDA6E|nr:hypothetical protein [Sneathiella glossodoripedis]